MFEILDRFFDIPVLLVVNGIANQSKTLDLAIDRFLMLDLVRIIPIIAALVYVAFDGASLRSRVETFVVAIAGSFFAILISRIAQNISERPRPIYMHIEGFELPFGTRQDIPADWSSFPSDTSALVFALAAAVLLRSRKLGILCVLWALVIAGFPRIYTGYHYPSDILAGGLIGIVSTVLVARWMPVRLVDLAEAIWRRYEPFCQAVVFVFLYLTATMFMDVRQTLDAIKEFVF